MGKTQSKTSTVILPQIEKDLSGQYETVLPFTLGEPLVDVIQHLKNEYDLLEFSRIEKNSSINPTSCDEAFKEHNKPKNRYTYVVPFDTTRVKLSPTENEEGTDYINASWVHGQTYIATQGPLPVTFYDFWRMIWQYNIKVIVMLTKTFENGRMKCHKYWPENTDAETYTDIKVVSCIEEEDEPNAITTRRFKVLNEKTSEEREVIHYQYHGWPDHGTPTNTKEIRELLKRMEEANGATKQAPIVVHCSAGIGRTGTLCTIHLTLGKVKEHLEKNPNEPYKFDLYSTVMELRSQRTGMVQQPEQYRFCYHSILDGCKELGLKVAGLEELFAEQSKLEDTPPPKKKKGKKKKHIKETLEEEPKTDEQPSDNTEPEVSPRSDTDGEKKRKKKKKKKHSDESTGAQVSEDTTDAANPTEKPKKRHRKKKEKITLNDEPNSEIKKDTSPIGSPRTEDDIEI